MSDYVAQPIQGVNTTSAGDQFARQVAELAGGGFAVAWTSAPATRRPSTQTARRSEWAFRWVRAMAPAGSAGLQFGDTRIALDAHGNGGMAWRLYESPENQAAVVGSIQGGMMYSLD